MKPLVALVLALVMAPLLVPAQAATLPLEVDGQELPTLAPLIERVAPAVVSLNLFNEQGRSSSVGSGVIVDADQGLILSNHHVVSKARRIQVTLSDNRSFDADLIGTDPEVDLALLKIEASQLTALTLVDSDQLRVGDFVLAIGNPFGLGHSVSSGIVSGLDRTGLGLEHYENFIQVDATINPGNSGGALVNLKGELVGINTAVVAPKGNSVGIGFAIPSNMAKTISMHLARSGRVTRGKMGIAVQDLNDSLREPFNIPAGQEGVLITEVKKDSAADKAGLQVGDVLTAINGRIVDSVENLRARLGLLTLNPNLQLDFLRQGEAMEVQANIRLPAQQPAGKVPVLHFGGATLRDDADKPGLVVAELQPESPAAEAGVMKNDIILQLNHAAVESLQDFAQHADRSANLLLIQRGPSSLFLMLEAPDADE